MPTEAPIKSGRRGIPKKLSCVIMQKSYMIKAETGNVGFLQIAARKLAVVSLSPVLRSERAKTDNDHGVDRAKEVLGQGNGLIIVINHFSLKDPPLAANEIFHHREMGSKKVIAPIAYHMDKSLYHWLGKLIGFKLVPIVTENTVKEGKNNNRESFEGKGKYLNASLNLLRQGGIVILAPQGTRQGTLGEPDKPSVGTLIRLARKKGVKNFAFLFMGFGIKGLDDYSTEKTRGFNFFSKYIVNIGACLTNQELMEKAGGDFRAVDGIVYEELRKVVPPNYR